MLNDALSIEASMAFPGFALDIAETIPLSGVTAVFGPSGCGKTTLLRLIAGFARADRGRIAFKRETWCDSAARVFTPAHRRDVGYLFQDSRLFPHLTVHGNLQFAEKRCGKDDRRYSFDHIVDATGVRTLLDRRTGALSGGERQRVALARTLLTRPQLLLFDEPLSALDRDRKAELLPFLESATKGFGIPSIYVSHDVDEVSRIADRVLVLREGKAAAFGPTEDTLNAFGVSAGRNPFEAASLLSGVVAQHDETQHLTEIAVNGDRMWLPLNNRLEPGAAVSVKIPARDVAISLARPEGVSIQNALAGVISEISEAPTSAFCEVRIDIGGQPLAARITRRAASALKLEKGARVYALIKSAGFQR